MSEITIIVRPIANGFLVFGRKEVGDYSNAFLPMTYVQSRAEVIAGLPSLFEAADALSEADAKENF